MKLPPIRPGVMTHADELRLRTGRSWLRDPGVPGLGGSPALTFDAPLGPVAERVVVRRLTSLAALKPLRPTSSTAT